MSGFFRQSLKARFFLVTALVLLGTCAGLYLLIDRIFLSYLQSEMQKQARELAEGLEDQLYNFVDPLQPQVSAERLLSERREISRIAVYRRAGFEMQRFISAEAVELPEDLSFYRMALNTRTMMRLEFTHKNTEYWEFIYPVIENNSVAGLITITLNFSQYRIFMSAVRSRTLLILIVGLTVMLIGVNLYTEIRVRRPVAEIVAAMEDVRRSNFEIRVNPRSVDEIGQLAADFNRMTQALGEAQDEILRQNRILEKRVNEATSELRSRNLELYQAQDQLRRASRLATAGQVAAMLAHDLGSPLSSISGHLQLMLEAPASTQEEQKRLNLILNQVERLSDTIRNFLSSVTGMEGHFTQTDLNALILHLIELTQPLLTERRIKALVTTDLNLPLLKADPNQIQQLFLNLFTNAMDAMRNGGELRVSTTFVAENSGAGQAVVKVEDNGTGMEPENLKNLFHPFFSTKEFGKGTGLGLAICKEIVRIHGGQISVESEAGRGTAFTLSFPAGNTDIQIDAEKIEPAYRG